MHKNYIWLAFLALTTGAVGWYTIKALYLLYLYAALNAQAPADNVLWGVEQIKNEKFVLKARYNFVAKGEKYAGETLFKNDLYWNHWAAEESIKVYEQKDWVVWYASTNPQYSTLQKNFPLKECISSAILWTLLFYFFGLGYYTARKG